jgi:hypothetical protein
VPVAVRFQYQKFQNISTPTFYALYNARGSLQPSNLHPNLSQFRQHIRTPFILRNIFLSPTSHVKRQRFSRPDAKWTTLFVVLRLGVGRKIYFSFAFYGTVSDVVLSLQKLRKREFQSRNIQISMTILRISHTTGATSSSAFRRQVYFPCWALPTTA